jgi:hypothetical protein
VWGPGGEREPVGERVVCLCLSLSLCVLSFSRSLALVALSVVVGLHESSVDQLSLCVAHWPVHGGFEIQHAVQQVAPVRQDVVDVVARGLEEEQQEQEDEDEDEDEDNEEGHQQLTDVATPA